MKDETENLLLIFKALSCRPRFDIVVGLIKNNECNVTKMSEKLNIPQPNVSQHLTVLKQAGIIEGFRKGNQICYKVVSEQVRRIIDAI
jgi:DNA-binding transcriptional ArsR family regulator